MVLWVKNKVDHSIGVVAKALADNGVEDQTLLFLTSDNGPVHPPPPFCSGNVHEAKHEMCAMWSLKVLRQINVVRLERASDAKGVQRGVLTRTMREHCT